MPFLELREAVRCCFFFLWEQNTDYLVPPHQPAFPSRAGQGAQRDFSYHKPKELFRIFLLRVHQTAVIPHKRQQQCNCHCLALSSHNCKANCCSSEFSGSTGANQGLFKSYQTCSFTCIGLVSRTLKGFFFVLFLFLREWEGRNCHNSSKPSCFSCTTQLLRC